MPTLALVGCAQSTSPQAYAEYEQSLLERNFLRVELAPADAPFNVERLTKTFQEVAFSYEFYFEKDEIVDERIDKPLKRWRGGVRYRLIGDGHTVEDKDEVTALASRLERLTGLSFVESTEHYNLLISIAGPKGREDISAYLQEQGKPVYRQRYDAWRQTPEWMCGATLSASRSNPNRLVFAHVFIRSEVSGLLRKACLQEEVVQSLGLTNDSDGARPSMFNDDLEFAVMTEHDEMLLRALYDERLTSGMSEEQAVPIAEEIFRELLTHQN